MKSQLSDGLYPALSTCLIYSFELLQIVIEKHLQPLEDRIIREDAKILVSF